MDQTASTLSECPVIMAMNGVSSSLGPQLMAKIGDVTRFTHREALTAFARVDPGKERFRKTQPEKCAYFKERLYKPTENTVSDHGWIDQMFSRG